jgi:threonine/homoserine/homoserine lactone efflux protein
MSIELYAAYLIACIFIVIVPGPTTTLIIANSLRHGTKAGLLNVAGTQLGLAVMVGVVGIVFTSLIAAMGPWFDWLRPAGAACLVWLGWKMIRSTGGRPTALRLVRAADFSSRGLRSPSAILRRCSSSAPSFPSSSIRCAIMACRSQLLVSRR